jgi:hypothetical protein
MQGLFQDIADLGNLLSNFAGGNASANQPLPGQFAPTGGCGGGNPTSGGSPSTGSPEGSQSCCGGGEDSREDRINDLLKQIMQMFGPLMQMFSQLLNLMLDNSGNNRILSQNRGAGFQI